MDSFQDYINQMIEEGYWAEDLTPLKCKECESKDLENKNHIFENIGCVEYEVWCNNCNKPIAVWSYGAWDI